MRILPVLIAAICYTLVARSQPRVVERLYLPGFEARVDSLVKAYTDLDIFSGVVLVAEKGRPVYHKAFGLAMRDKNIPNTPGTRFDIGSMNKSFTKVVVLQLVHEGKLSLDDKLGKYLPGFPKKAAEDITLRHLLNHQSGYGGYHSEEYWNIPREEKTLQTALEQIKKQPLEFDPGTDRRYSNAGYVLLGLIAEKAAGKSYFDLVEERIAKPLGMQDTYLREKYTVPNRAIGYYKNMRGELLDNDSFQEIVKPDGGFYSTASDILKFYRAYHHGTSLWNRETQMLDEGYARYQKLKKEGGITGHAGGFEGANTVYLEFLREQVAVVVFANMDEVVAENLGQGIVAILRGEAPEQPGIPAIQAVYKAFSEQGLNYVKAHWESLTTNFHPEDPKDLILNMIGYSLLREGETRGAVEVFKLNTELFPGVANVWDSYGEALRKMGHGRQALRSYKKALSIQPGIPSAEQALRELEAEGY